MQNGTEWLVIVDPTTKVTYHFDLTFFLSRHNCIYGRGCKGVNLNPVDGCCNIGAGMTKDEVHRVRRFMEAHFDAEKYSQHAEEIEEQWFVKSGDDEDDYNTRVVGGSCIFSNSADHELPGCALWHAANDAGADVDDARPSACSTYPLQLKWEEVNEENHLFVGPHRRVTTWAAEGTDWWCVDDAAAYSDDNMTAWLYYESTLRRHCGDRVYEDLRRHCEHRFSAGLNPDYGKPLGAGANGRNSTVPITVPVSLPTVRRKRGS